MLLQFSAYHFQAMLRRTERVLKVVGVILMFHEIALEKAIRASQSGSPISAFWYFWRSTATTGVLENKVA